MSNDTIKLRLKHGQVEFEAEGPLEAINHLLDKVWKFSPTEDQTEDPIPLITKRQVELPAHAKKKDRQKVRQKSNSTTDAEKTIKLGASFYKDFEPIKLDLSDQQEITAKAEYSTIKPNTNKDKAILALNLLTKMIPSVQNFNYDQIYMMLRICGEKNQPSNMSQTVGELISSNLASKEAEGIRLKIQGSDYVANSIKAHGQSDDPK